MKLKKLIVHGFKSFKDRTKIQFDKGITGIVGPNGCGKSNIVDALFWVMGEQSAKHLRGNSMKDVIFAGSSKYSPSSFAEVSLILENESGKHIHIGNKVSSPSQIQLTRKLYRNGETEYRINNIPCRLKDVQEVFMDTGAGAKSYSIIAQGEINRLVQAKPIERRVMIEEVAGITKFKVRKKESLRKIEQTEDNLNRLNDLRVEIEKNLKALHSQMERAEKAKALKEKIKRNDLVTQAHKEFDVLKNYQCEKKSLEEKEAEVKDFTTKKNTLEIDLQNERLKRDEEIEIIDTFQSEFNELSKKLAAKEERFHFLKEGLAEKQQLIATRENELQDISQERVKKEKKKDSFLILRDELEAIEAEDFDLAEFEENFSLKKEQLEERESRLSELKIAINEHSEELSEVDQEIFKNNSKLEEYANGLQDMALEIEAIEGQYSGLSSEMMAERETVQELEKKLKLMSDGFDHIKHEIIDLENLSKSIIEKLDHKNLSFIQTESKLNSLIELNRSFEGVKAGNSHFLKTDSIKGFDIVGNLIQSEKKYSKAVEGLLCQILDSLVTNQESFKDLTNWFAKNNEHTIDFIFKKDSIRPTSSNETIEKLKLMGLCEVVALKEVVVIAKEYQAAIGPLLEGYFIVEKLPQNSIELEGIDCLGIIDCNASIILKDKGNYSMVEFKGENSEASGMVTRNNRISELKKELFPLSKELKELEKQKEEVLESLALKRQQHDLSATKLHEQTAIHAAKKSAIESKTENFEKGNARLEILKTRKKKTSSERFKIQEQEEGLKNKKELINGTIDELKDSYKLIEVEYKDLNEVCNDTREELIQRQVDAKTFDEKLKNNCAQIEDIEEQLLNLKERQQTGEEQREKNRSEMTAAQQEITELEASNGKIASHLAEKERELLIQKDNLNKLISFMQERESEVKDLTQKINRAEKKIIAGESKLARFLIDEEQIVRNTFEKYHINLRNVLSIFLEYSEEERLQLSDISNLFVMETENGIENIPERPYEFTRRYGQDLKDCEVKFRQYKQELNRLGEINWQALEEYKRQKIRCDFLKEQEVELKQSLLDLEQAILHIDEKSKSRFKTAFEEVSFRFQKVFPIIFGGGNALLEIKGAMDDPECGVDIVASPPGKKMQNINLMSGGEKALTAVSLIFSIFLVKPSPFCLLDEVDAPLDDANVGRFNELLREMSYDSQFILITHNKKTMELNDTLYGVTMQDPGVSKAISVQLQ